MDVAQWGVVVLASLQLLWTTAGLIAEPSVDFGDGAVTKQVLGVDFNGIHVVQIAHDRGRLVDRPPN